MGSQSDSSHLQVSEAAAVRMGHPEAASGFGMLAPLEPSHMLPRERYRWAWFSTLVWPRCCLSISTPVHFMCPPEPADVADSCWCYDCIAPPMALSCTVTCRRWLRPRTYRSQGFSFESYACAEELPSHRYIPSVAAGWSQDTKLLPTQAADYCPSALRRISKHEQW
jgi:hypothetical protein